MNVSARSEREVGLIVDAVTDALKAVLPSMIEKEIRRQLDEQKPKRWEPTQAELDAMGERHRQNLIVRGVNPETLQRFAPGELRAMNEARATLRTRRAVQGMSGAAARRQRR